ncbi:MAG: glycosyltransferase family 4 protein [Myxococcota bacterium]
MTPRVLFVSKAITPPFRDGASCLVAELASALPDVHPTVMSTDTAPPPAPHVHTARIYRGRSRYAPALVDNARVFGHLLADREHALWHFVFAPNPLSSNAGKALRTIRRKPVVQTVASRPLRFDASHRLLFGDRVIALSRHTANALVAHGASAARIDVIAPPVADLSRSEQEQREARRALGVAPDVPLFVYAGDLEFSQGATWMARAAPAILRALPDAIVAYACRAKTPRAAKYRERIADQLAAFANRVRFLGEVEDLPALLASATAMPFPVEDLYGKVDLPYVVLEAALLRVPVMVVEGTPLMELACAPTMKPGDVDGLAAWCIEMGRDPSARTEIGRQLRAWVRSEHDPERVARRVRTIYEALL